MTEVFATWDDAAASIAAAIEASGVVESAAAEYDLDAITDAVLVWDDGYDPETRVYWLNRQGWRIIKDTDEFWRVVEHHTYRD